MDTMDEHDQTVDQDTNDLILKYWRKRQSKFKVVRTCSICKKKFKYWGAYKNHKHNCTKKINKNTATMRLSFYNKKTITKHPPIGQSMTQNRMTTTFYKDGKAIAWECRRKCDSEIKRWYNRNEYYNHFRKYHATIKHCPVDNRGATFKRYDLLHKHILKIHKDEPKSFE